MFLRMAGISFGALPCKGGKNLMTARVSMLLKPRASLTCFRACFLPGRAKDLSAPRYSSYGSQSHSSVFCILLIYDQPNDTEYIASNDSMNTE